MTANRFAQEVDDVLRTIGDMLKRKNMAYGNSALDPVRVFSRADTVEQLKVRIDDKLSRIMRGQAAGEDVEDDLLGYLVILRIARLRLKCEANGDDDVCNQCGAHFPYDPSYEWVLCPSCRTGKPSPAAAKFHPGIDCDPHDPDELDVCLGCGETFPSHEPFAWCAECREKGLHLPPATEADRNDDALTGGKE